MRRKIYCFWEYFLGKILFLLKKMKSLLTLYFSIEISSFWPLSYWNLLFLITFLLKSLLSEHLSIEISTFSLLFYWNLLFLTTFLLKSPLSDHFPIEISTFSLLSIEISTFPLLFYWILSDHFPNEIPTFWVFKNQKKPRKILVLQFTVSSKREKTKHFLGVFWFLGSWFLKNQN